MERKLLTGLAFLGGVASIVALLISLTGQGYMLSSRHVKYDQLLIYGGAMCAFMGRAKSLIPDFWQNFAKGRQLCLTLKLLLSVTVLTMGGLALSHYISIYGYNVLPEGITVAMGNAAYAKMTFVVYFCIMLFNVFCLTAPPRHEEGE